jgi:hypothetical protein
MQSLSQQQTSSVPTMQKKRSGQMVRAVRRHQRGRSAQIRDA